MSWISSRGARALAALSLGLFLSGCPAVYPELPTALHRPAADVPLDPPPPGDLKWIRIVSARIPNRTRDGRPWDQAFGSLPDPYAKLFVNGKEVLRTPAQSDTLEPSWPDAPSGNFKLLPEDRVRIELWDSNPLNDKPIGVREIGRITDEQRQTKQIRAELEGGAEVLIAFEPAHAMLGLGLWYELRTDSCFITRLLTDSPAERAGVVSGDEVVKIGGRLVQTMSADEVRSAFNSVPVSGLALTLRHADGSNLEAALREGPIYPPYSQYGAVP